MAEADLPLGSLLWLEVWNSILSAFLLPSSIIRLWTFWNLQLLCYYTSVMFASVSRDRCRFFFAIAVLPHTSLVRKITAFPHCIIAVSRTQQNQTSLLQVPPYLPWQTEVAPSIQRDTTAENKVVSFLFCAGMNQSRERSNPVSACRLRFQMLMHPAAGKKWVGFHRKPFPCSVLVCWLYKTTNCRMGQGLRLWARQGS